MLFTVCLGKKCLKTIIKASISKYKQHRNMPSNIPNTSEVKRPSGHLPIPQRGTSVLLSPKIILGGCSRV